MTDDAQRRRKFRECLPARTARRRWLDCIADQHQFIKAARTGSHSRRERGSFRTYPNTERRVFDIRAGEDVSIIAPESRSNMEARVRCIRIPPRLLRNRTR